LKVLVVSCGRTPGKAEKRKRGKKEKRTRRTRRRCRVVMPACQAASMSAERLVVKEGKRRRKGRGKEGKKKRSAAAERDPLYLYILTSQLPLQQKSRDRKREKISHPGIHSTSNSQATARPLPPAAWFSPGLRQQGRGREKKRGGKKGSSACTRSSTGSSR